MAMERKSRLGRGLEALISSSPNGEQTGLSQAQAEVAVGAIDQNPYQPRRNFDEEELSSLGESIRTHGVLQPLVVRPKGDRYQLVAGERRLRAARAVGMTSVPVRIVDFNDQQVLEAALAENIHRTDLNAIEKAQGFKDYLERFQMTHEELAKRLGLARVTITNLLGVLELPVEIQDEVRRGQLTIGHAKLLKGINDSARQLQFAKEIIARGLSVHATETFIKQQLHEKPPETEPDPKPVIEKTAHVLGIEDELRQKLATRVEIRLSAMDKGQVVIRFESNDDFERILDLLRR
jgi:ParB family chromosome partitioning protein